MTAAIYLDNQATTPIDPRVAEAMRPFLDGIFGNPHSEHAYGWQAASAIEKATEHVAALIGADPGEIIFTSGATEANNLALQGVARGTKNRGNHIIASAIEHKCVLNTALWLGTQDFDVDIVPVDANGLVDLQALEEAIRDETILVSVMLANNEIGTIQPLEQISALCRPRGIVLHTDAAQAVGKIPVNVDQLGVDLLSLSAHKFYGPKGIGALYISGHCPAPVSPLLLGGAQQDGRRAGTLSPLLCAGIGAAARIGLEDLEQDGQHLKRLSEAFWERLNAHLDGLQLNGAAAPRLPGTLNVVFPQLDADSLLTALQRHIAASTGSACNAGLIGSSYVLTALGLNAAEIYGSIRFGFGRFNTLNEVVVASNLIVEKVTHFYEQHVFAST